MAATKSNERALNLCFTMPVTFYLYKFCTKYIKNYHPKLPWPWHYRHRNSTFEWSTTSSNIQQTPSPWWFCFDATAAWLWQISPPHPWVPLRKGLGWLGEGDIEGFYSIMSNGWDKNLILLTANYFIYFYSVLLKAMVLHFPHATPRSRTLSILSPIAGTCFRLVVV